MSILGILLIIMTLGIAILIYDAYAQAEKESKYDILISMSIIMREMKTNSEELVQHPFLDLEKVFSVTLDGREVGVYYSDKVSLYVAKCPNTGVWFWFTSPYVLRLYTSRPGVIYDENVFVYWNIYNHI